METIALNRDSHQSAAISQSKAPAGAGSLAESVDAISVLDLLLILARHKQLIFWITLASSAASVVVAFLLPVRYLATVTLFPPQQSSSLSSTLAAQIGNMGGGTSLASGGLSLKNSNDLYVSLLKSRVVEDAMIQRFGLMQEYNEHCISDARNKLDKQVVIDGSGKDGLIRLSVTDRNPVRAAEMANGYVEEFQKFSENRAITEAAQRRLFFQKQLKITQGDLASAEEALKATEQKTGIVQLDSQAKALISSAAALHAQVSSKEVEIKAMRTYAAGENSQLIEAEQELSALRAQLAKLGSAGTPDSGSIDASKEQVTEAGLEYVRKVRDVKYYEAIFDILARQFEAAKLDEAKQGSVIQVMDPAMTPDKKSSPRRGIFVMALTLVGLFFSILTAVSVEVIEKMKENPETAHKLTMIRNMFSTQKTA